MERDEAAHGYTAPERSAAPAIPDALARYLDGTGLAGKDQALRISTVDAQGWPHAALLSAGDMLALPSGRLRFVVFPQSTGTANLLRDGRASVTAVLDGAMVELRMTCRAVEAPHGLPLAMFEATPVEARVHRAPYAALSAGITFALHDPAAVLPRWERQVASMRAVP